MTTTVLNVGSRGRVTLGSLAKSSHYKAQLNDDGSVILTPVHMITDMEKRILANPQALAAVREDPSAVANRSVARPSLD